MGTVVWGLQSCCLSLGEMLDVLELELQHSGEGPATPFPLPAEGLQPFLAGLWGDEQEVTFPECRQNMEAEGIFATSKKFWKHLCKEIKCKLREMGSRRV